MKSRFTHFGELYCYLERTENKESFLHYRDGDSWRGLSKKSFLLTIRYLTLAAYKNEWRGKQVAIAVASSPYWLMLDYALMLAGSVSVPVFTNISSRNLHF